MATKKIPAKTIVEAIGSHVGSDGDLFYDTTTNALRISDGSTAGGAAVGFGGALESDAISSANAAFVTINDNVKISWWFSNWFRLCGSNCGCKNTDC